MSGRPTPEEAGRKARGAFRGSRAAVAKSGKRRLSTRSPSGRGLAKGDDGEWVPDIHQCEIGRRGPARTHADRAGARETVLPRVWG